MNPVITPWLFECVIITARTVRREQRPPLPSEFVATFVIFGTAGMVASAAPKPAAAFAWGIVIASMLNLFDINGKLRDPLGSRRPAPSLATVPPVLGAKPR